MKKIIVGLVMAGIMLFSTLTPLQMAEASETVETNSFAKLDLSKPFVPLSDNEVSEIVNSDLESYSIELTYEQAIARTSQITGKPIEQLIKENPQPNAMARAASCSWVETKTPIMVKSHKAYLLVMPKACRDGSFGWINKTEKPLLQEFQADKYKFDGTVAIDLRDAGFMYKINGNFHNASSVTHAGTVGLSAIFTATYTVSGSSSLYGSLTTPLTWVQVIN